MEDLADVIEERNGLRRGAIGLGAIVLITWGLSAWWGAREYRACGNATAAEARIEEALSDSIPERLAFYGTLPGRRLGYWLAK